MFGLDSPQYTKVEGKAYCYFCKHYCKSRRVCVLGAVLLYEESPIMREFIGYENSKSCEEKNKNNNCKDWESPKQSDMPDPY